MTGFTTRPVIMGTRGVVTSGHYLATAAGFRIMEQGGNAIDASAAMCICLNLLEPQSNGIGGEVPTLIYSEKDKKAYAISGMGWSPATLTIDWCRKNGIDLIPGDGYLPACVPATVGTWAVALARFGTMTYSQVLQPAIELAENGFPLYDGLQNALRNNYERFTELYPTTGEVYYDRGRVPEYGEIIRNPAFGKSLRMMCKAENEAKSRGRVAGIEAACDAFYRGPIAERIVKFITDNPVQDATGKSHSGLLTYEDISDWHASVEETVSYDYKGLTVHKCPSWTQGPTFLQHLAILDGIDIKAMGHNSAEYLHTWLESTKLAFADREAYYGDPLFDEVPLDILLSREYNNTRRELIGSTASMEQRPGDVGNGIPAYAITDIVDDNRAALGIAGTVPGEQDLKDIHEGDTTHLDAVDHHGNMVSATPSGGWLPSSPVIKDVGFPIGTRGQMFYLNPNRPNALEPRKRPRATLTPSLVTRNGEPYMVFGTPGGDIQEQITLQFFLNYVEFNMNIQESLDAPTVRTSHMPSSFYPRKALPGRVSSEGRIPETVTSDLENMGHKVERVDDWNGGKVLAIRYDQKRGIILGGASPKADIGYAFGW